MEKLNLTVEEMENIKSLEGKEVQVVMHNGITLYGTLELDKINEQEAGYVLKGKAGDMVAYVVHNNETVEQLVRQ